MKRVKGMLRRTILYCQPWMKGGKNDAGAECEKGNGGRGGEGRGTKQALRREGELSLHLTYKSSQVNKVK